MNNSSNATIRLLSYESSDTISNTEVIDEGAVVTAEIVKTMLMKVMNTIVIRTVIIVIRIKM